MTTADSLKAHTRAEETQHEQRRRKQTLDRAKANHLMRQLQMRLQYARLKVERGWQRQNLNEVENLYFRHSSNPKPITLAQPAPLAFPPDAVQHDTQLAAPSDPPPSDAALAAPAANLNPHLNLPPYTHYPPAHELRLSHPQPVQAANHHPNPKPAAALPLPPSRTLPTPPLEPAHTGHYRAITNTANAAAFAPPFPDHPSGHGHYRASAGSTAAAPASALTAVPTLFPINTFPDPDPGPGEGGQAGLTYDAFWSGFRAPSAPAASTSPAPQQEREQELDMARGMAHNLGLGDISVVMGDVNGGVGVVGF
ncbi:hypothetical protein FIBSPDRAFT_852737 [Athelia psychrophila]|uniref:Uncharacterized protein n=1 Tax=Athelia psychrophila TaxID=1759441 RepID=A0A166RG20_9AGAM|nr:hypothetical protein FIBSPDRAFT_852737 [Fibularhizoctonia sp. CBS 109695]